MHQSVVDYLRRVRGFFPNKFDKSYVLDVGSLDINWNNRRLLTNCGYIGIDLYKWRNVDHVWHLINYTPKDPPDLIISTEALEHDKLRKETLHKMVELLKPNGLLVVTCAGISRREHWTTERWPSDSPATNTHYRNLDTQDILSVIPDAVIEESESRDDIRFYYLKK